MRHYASTSFINQQPPPPPLTPQQPQASPTYAYFPLHAHTNPLDPYAFSPDQNYFQGSPSPTTTTFADYTRFLPPPPPQQPANNYLLPSSPTSIPHGVYPVRQPGLQHKHSMPTLGTQQAPLYENYLFAHTPQQPPPPQLHQYQPPQTRMRSMRSNQHLQADYKSTNRSAVLEDFRVNGKHTKPELHVSRGVS